MRYEYIAEILNKIFLELKEQRDIYEKYPNGILDFDVQRSEEHTSELQSPCNLVCRLLLEKKKLRIREFLTRNGHPFHFVDLDRDADAQELLDRFHVSVADVPVLICGVETVLRNPTHAQIADCLGFNETVDQTRVHDLVVVGAGPAGLA